MKLRMTVVLSLMIAVTATITSAQSDLWMLSKPAALRAYALAQANMADEYAGSASLIGTEPYSGLILSTNHSSADIIRFFDTTPLTLRVANPNDQVWLWGTVMNSDYDMLFYGFSVTNTVAGKGGHTLPEFNLILEINSVIPVYFDGSVSSAEFIGKDPTTQQTTFEQPLTTSGNKVYVQYGQQGSGFLVVQIQNESTPRIYDLANNGVRIPASVLSIMTTNALFDNLISYQNPGQVIDSIWSLGGIGTNHTYEIIESSPSGVTNWVDVSVTSSEGAKPLGVWVWQPGNTAPQYYPQAQTLPYVPVPLNGGTSYMYPEWDPFQFSDPVPQYDYYSGAKG